MNFKFKSSNTTGRPGKGDFKNILEPETAEAEIVANVRQKVQWFLNVTRTMRRQWLINSAFSRGQQFCVLHRTEDRLITLQEPGRRKQITDDMIGPWVEHMVANMVTAMPVFEVVPPNLSSESVQAARAGQALLGHYWDDWRFASQYIEHATNLLNFGTSLIYLNYLADGSKLVSEQAIDASTGMPAMDDNGSPLLATRVVGDITAEMLVPQSLICPVDPSPLDSKPWVILQVRRELDYFLRQYENGADVRADEIDYVNEYDLSYINGEYGNRSLKDGQVQYANEYIYFQKPAEGNREGIIAMVAGNVLLKPRGTTKPAIAKWPYKKLTTYPIVHISWRREPGEFFARSPIERQIPLQKAINLAQSIIAENMDEMAHIKTLIPNQAGVATPSDANEILRYIYPFKPEYMQPAPVVVKTTILPQT